LPSIKTEVQLPPIANNVPHVHIWWDESQIKISVPDVVKKLRDGEPSIEVTPGSREHLIVNPWMLAPNEVKIVARQIRSVLTSA
jgi:L-seryl-tRNA(Ser) seleniumtransferase